jgi:Putative Actinobacterial Holin-X, holin superfamily III
MKKIGELIESLYHTGIGYVETNVELFRLKIINKSTEIVSTLGANIIIVFVFLIFLTIISIGLAIWLGELWGRMHYGFFAVGGFYGFIFLVLVVFRRRLLKQPISNSVVHHITK